MALIKSVRGFTPSIGKDTFLADNATIIGDVVIGEGLGGGGGHGLAAGGEMIVGDTTIEDAVRVVDFAVANEVNDGVGHDGWDAFRFPLIVTVWVCGG